LWALNLKIFSCLLNNLKPKKMIIIYVKIYLIRLMFPLFLVKMYVTCVIYSLMRND
jgi:hypothetical protein